MEYQVMLFSDLDLNPAEIVTAWNRDSREHILVIGQEEAEPTFSAARATVTPTDETR